MGMKAKAPDLIGKRFHKLLVIGREDNEFWGGSRWKVQCDCGVVKVTRGSALVTNRVKSCGCSARGKRATGRGPKGRFTHGWSE